jgi:hypothetical protein
VTTPRGPELIPIDGGYRVGETATHYLDAIKMLYSWRLCETPKACPLVCDRYWCYAYAGSEPQALLAVIAAVRAWNGAQDTEPDGWNKNGQTGEWREPSSLVDRWAAPAEDAWIDQVDARSDELTRDGRDHQQ